MSPSTPQVKDVRDRAAVSKVLTSVLGTKYYGYQETLAPYVAEACLAVIAPAPKKPSLSVDAVRVCKLQGGNISDSQMMKGMVLARYVNSCGDEWLWTIDDDPHTIRLCLAMW